MLTDEPFSQKDPEHILQQIEKINELRTTVVCLPNKILLKFSVTKAIYFANISGFLNFQDSRNTLAIFCDNGYWVLSFGTASGSANMARLILEGMRCVVISSVPDSKFDEDIAPGACRTKTRPPCSTEAALVDAMQTMSLKNQSSKSLQSESNNLYSHLPILDEEHYLLKSLRRLYS